MVIGLQTAAITLGAVFEDLGLVVVDDDAWATNALLVGFERAPLLMLPFALVAAAGALLAHIAIRAPIEATVDQDVARSST